MKYREIENEEDLRILLSSANQISQMAFQNLNFTFTDSILENKQFSDCLFLGCKLPDTFGKFLLQDNLIFPETNTPYNSYLNSLYTKSSLLGGYALGDPDSYESTLDKIVYNHYITAGKEAQDIKETLSRRLHDHSITDALYDFLAKYDEKKIVAVMGGHDLPRNNLSYFDVAKISKKLTELGYLVVSGGGPGAMEASHLGAWFAGRDEEELKIAFDILSQAPSFKDRFWLDKAFQVLDQYPDTTYDSLGIPTWLYGHEPPTPFASKIAKYFDNSIREEGLLAIAKGGVIFAPGSAGTIQEIFQDAVQNHYLSFGYASPMVFLNQQYWTDERPIYPLLKEMSDKGKYKNLILSIFDNKDDVVAEILKFTSIELTPAANAQITKTY
ncbi:hypothetical protein SD960_02355 [Flavobacterium sp. MMLR14_040]|uniref:LOG family protein n=1 Tax=Flavobacterium sp. MMLR14_040 TaxID=3093843 RepID=UPI00298F9886|nr:hypothetical protein [Flavobacterium sp. MMLR14_040]MDW8848920.1 hypothetical protein [Flavobacterium sp. MMLR14_040]